MFDQAPYLVYNATMQGGLNAHGVSSSTHTPKQNSSDSVWVLLDFCDRWGLNNLDYIAYTLPDVGQLQQDLMSWSDPNEEDKAAVADWLHGYLADEKVLFQHLMASEPERVRMLSYDYTCESEGSGNANRVEVSSQVHSDEDGRTLDDAIVDYLAFNSWAVTAVGSILTAQSILPYPGYVAFHDVEIPADAIINLSYVTFRGLESDAIDGENATFWLSAQLDPLDGLYFLPTDSQAASRTKTEARKEWAITEAWEDDTDYNTPDISCILNEWREHGGGTDYTDLLIYWGFPAQTIGARRAERHTNRPILHVFYSFKYDEVQSGGVECSGAADLEFIYNVETSGGVKCSSYTPAISYEVVIYTTSTTFIPELSGTVTYLMVGAGGGGGFDYGGGGGGGGVLTGTVSVTAGTSYTITVGAGGAGGNGSVGSTGGNTTAFELTAYGGGGGSSGPGGAATNGGCGGGGGPTNTTKGTGTAGQGYDGGAGSDAYYANASGGGGGAGGAGEDAVGGSTSGDGGIGVLSSLDGTATYYGCGGGGGGYVGYGISAGVGANGLGGNGGYNGGEAGGNATGCGNGGGGGAGGNGLGGDGGDGVVILQYPVYAQTGVLLSGVAVVEVLDYLTPDVGGSCVCGGAALLGVVVEQSISGGCVCGGLADVLRLSTITETTEGGLLSGGAAYVQGYEIITESCSGGMVCGGLADYVGSTTMECGGGLLVCTPAYPNGYLHRISFEIPEVAVAIPGFVARITTILNPAKVLHSGQDVLVCTREDIPLPTTLLSYNEGRIHVLFKTDLAPSDNLFFMYYGRVRL